MYDLIDRAGLTRFLCLRASPVQNPDDPYTADIFMDMLDVDHNKKIDFAEFLLMVFKLAQVYYESSRRKTSKALGQKQKKGHLKNHVEDDREEEEQEGRKRRSSQSKTDGNRKKSRSRSPRGRGGRRHGSRSEGREGRRKECPRGHGDRDEKRHHHKASGEKKSRSPAHEVQGRRQKSKVGPTAENRGKDDEYDYDISEQLCAKWNESQNNGSCGAYVNNISREHNNLIKDNIPPYFERRNGRTIDSQASDSEGQAGDSSRRSDQTHSRSRSGTERGSNRGQAVGHYEHETNQRQSEYDDAQSQYNSTHGQGHYQQT